MICPANSIRMKSESLLEKTNLAARENTGLLSPNRDVERCIVQTGKQRAFTSGKRTFKQLSKDLTKEFGKGFSVSNLYNMRVVL